MELKRGATVRVKALTHPITDKSIDPIHIKSRRQHMVGIADSPIYGTFNHHWMVKHITSRESKSLSVSKYGVYHENELEVIPPIRSTEEPEEELSSLDLGLTDYNPRWEEE